MGSNILHVEIPTSFIEEKKYTIEFLFSTILGFSICWDEVCSTKSYKLKFDNAAILEIEDHFFYKYKDDSYIKGTSLPSKVIYYKNSPTADEPTPVLYGEDMISARPNHIKIGYDLISSTFFMLSRWEETMDSPKDRFNRFPAKNAAAVKLGFIQKPVVNEYIEIIKNLMGQLGVDFKNHEKQFRFFNTHDIDFVLKWETFFDFAKTISGDITKRKSLHSAIENIGYKLKSVDTYDTFNYLMASSEVNKLKSTFYILCDKRNRRLLNRKEIRETIDKIIAGGHKIGLHPDFDTYNNKEKLMEEKYFLEKLLSIKITDTRQHYLQFDVNQTWNLLAECGFTTDSSMYYPEIAGYRCGIADNFPVFDLKTKKTLPINERPICFMDTSVFKFTNADEAQQWISDQVETIKKYKGDFVFLWHNSSFDPSIWGKYQDIYLNTILQHSK